MTTYKEQVKKLKLARKLKLIPTGFKLNQKKNIINNEFIRLGIGHRIKKSELAKEIKGKKTKKEQLIIRQQLQNKLVEKIIERKQIKNIRDNIITLPFNNLESLRLALKGVAGKRRRVIYGNKPNVIKIKSMTYQKLKKVFLVGGAEFH